MYLDRRLPILLLATGIAALAATSCRESNKTSERTCRGTQALTSVKFKGAGLPPKTVALTFDDGPGVRTEELSRWLKNNGVRAGFFVNGKMLGRGSEAVLQGLVADGHVIGNHTQTHADLTTLGVGGVVSEVEQTDALIARFVPDGRFMFRPPFGAYNESTFSALGSSTMNKYVGPIDWDIGEAMGPSSAADWDCWSVEGTSVPPVVDPTTCGDLYLAEIRQKSNGIVLLHDPYFIDDDPEKGGTVDMVKYIVPILKAEGFTFVRVDEVPAIATALPPLTTPASNGAATSGGSAAGSQAGQGAGGDSSEPCPPSPQASAGK
jgi:peptidoglycan-N-acetylglucosamine deacetylase